MPGVVDWRCVRIGALDKARAKTRGRLPCCAAGSNRTTHGAVFEVTVAEFRSPSAFDGSLSDSGGPSDSRKKALFGDGGSDLD